MTAATEAGPRIASLDIVRGVAVMGGVEASLRQLGPTSLFGWLRRIEWRNPGVAALTVK